jgi:LuxR family maltose regulon positive regulatory protein
MPVRAAGARAVVGLSRPRGPGDLPVDILESKLYSPAIRPGVISRPQLLARLGAARDVPTVAVIAPAGYGKTTLLALWGAADERPFAWLSLDPHDNDPIVLLTHLAVALDRISPLPPETFDALRSAGVSVPATVVPRLGSALTRLPHPVVLVVDDVHHLEDGPSLDALVTLVGHVRGSTQIALAGRAMPMPLARPRAQGQVVEIGVEDLAFTEGGARSLLRAAGADLPNEEVVALTRRTEGWAAGLYLAALSRTGTRHAERIADAGTGHRLVADYLQSELLSQLSPQELSFLTRTSVLERLHGPLCDAVLGEPGSAAELEHLQQKNLFLVPLDGQRRWYRYHPMFRDLLRARLRRAGPEHARELLRRAADWCETDGQLEAALHYAQDSDDVDRMARLAIALGQPMYASGRWTTLMGWFEWVGERGVVERHPAISAQAALLCALTGRPAAADRWADLAESLSGRPPDDDGAGHFALWLTSARALMCRRGVEQMRRDVEVNARPVLAARAGEDTDHPMWLFLGGTAHLLLGDAETAQDRLSDATELTDEASRAPLVCIILAYRALIALGREDWYDAEILVERALEVARRRHAESYLTALLAFVLASRVALHRGDTTLARSHLAEAQSLRPLLSYAMPWYAVECLLQMAEVSIGLGDSGGSRIFVRDADAVLRRRPDLGTLAKRTDEMRGRLGTLRAAGSDSSTLTSSELRLLPLLLTHLTLADIADRLFLSRHTVKSHVWSMYRKFGVHTRSEAIARARELGLLEA